MKKAAETGACVCGGQIKITTEDIRYDDACLAATGLDVMLEGMLVARCTACGFVDTAAMDLVTAQFAVSGELVRKKWRLTPREIRFLRKDFMTWSGVQLARAMGVAPGVVSRWENKGDIGAMADRMLRLLVHYQMLMIKPERAPFAPPLGAISDTAMESRLRLRQVKGFGWKVVDGLATKKEGK